MCLTPPNLMSNNCEYLLLTGSNIWNMFVCLNCIHQKPIKAGLIYIVLELILVLLFKIF